MSALQNLRANARFSLREPAVRAGDPFHLLPLTRSPLLTLFAGGFFIAFCVPLFGASGMLDTTPDDSLFTIVHTLFTLFWMLGWSVGVAFLALLFLASLFGRESVHAVPGTLTIKIGAFGAGIAVNYRTEAIESLRWEVPAEKSPYSWRGPHLAFEYEGRSVRFGCGIDPDRAKALIDELERAFERAAPPDEHIESRQARSASRPLTHARGSEPITLRSPSAIALILANVVPVLGVLFAGWQIGEVMLLFWAESAIVGFYNLCKMWVIGRWSLLFYGPFFVGHYGGFMSVHLLFIYALFFGRFGEGIDATVTTVTGDLVALAPALAALFVSHGISFWRNFMGRREFEGRAVAKQMGEPYARIIVMHITIIFGGFMTMIFSDALPALLLMIALKVGVDLYAHLKERGTGRIASQ